MAVWTCPSCGRRVPDRVEACHCGAPRPAAIPPGVPLPPAAPGHAGALAGPLLPSWKSLPRDIRIGLGLLAVLVVGALASLFIPDRGRKLPALLGHVDPSPTVQEVRPSPLASRPPAPGKPRHARPAPTPAPQDDGG
jgi:hypothetical protein